MKLAFVLIILASFLIAASFAEPESHTPCHSEEGKRCAKEQKCCDLVPGRDGSNGRDGRQGRDGINGQDGIDGQDGTNGVDGRSVPSEYAQVYSTFAGQVDPAVNPTLVFEGQGYMSSGFTHVTTGRYAGILTVHRGGQYMVGVLLLLAGTSGPATVFLEVNGQPANIPVNSMAVGGGNTFSALTVSVPLNAGDMISFTTNGVIEIASLIAGPSMNLNIFSVSLD